MFRQKLLLAVPILILPFVVRSDSRIPDSVRLLAEADRFALLYNWPEATRRYAQAEAFFKQSGIQAL